MRIARYHIHIRVCGCVEGRQAVLVGRVETRVEAVKASWWVPLVPFRGRKGQKLSTPL